MTSVRSRGIPLPVLRDTPRLVECTECGRCCTYVGVGINPPTTPRLASDVLWYLYHAQVYVYVDGDGEWSVLFETRCRNLGAELRCGIYAERPHICRSFDNRGCEVNDPGHATLTFREPVEFLDWLRSTQPRLHARIAKGFVPELAPTRRAAAARVARVRGAVACKART